MTSPNRTGLAIIAHALLRIAGSADGVIVGLYLAQLSRSHRDIQAGVVGLLGAAAYGAELVASVPLGVAADAWSARTVMVAGALTSALGTRLFAVAVSTPLFIVSRLLQGAGVAAVTPPLLKVLADSTRRAPARRARTMGLFELSMLSGLALGGLVGSQLWVHRQERAFSAVALLGIICALLLGLAVRGVRGQGATDALSGLRKVLQDPFVRRLAPSWVCANAIVGLWLGPTLTFLLTARSRGDQYLTGLFAGAPARVGWLLFGYSILFGIGVSAWSVALPRLRPLGALRVSLSAMLAVCGALFAINHSVGWTGTTRVAVLAVAALLVMVESGFTPVALTWLAQSLEALGGKGAAMGIYSLLLGLGAMTGSVLAAVLGMRWQIDGLLLGTVSLAAIALGLLTRLPGSGRALAEGAPAMAASLERPR